MSHRGDDFRPVDFATYMKFEIFRLLFEFFVVKRSLWVDISFFRTIVANAVMLWEVTLSRRLWILSCASLVVTLRTREVAGFCKLSCSFARSCRLWHIKFCHFLRIVSLKLQVSYDLSRVSHWRGRWRGWWVFTFLCVRISGKVEFWICKFFPFRTWHGKCSSLSENLVIR
jgi:hypothetical protein